MPLLRQVPPWARAIEPVDRTYLLGLSGRAHSALLSYLHTLLPRHCPSSNTWHAVLLTSFSDGHALPPWARLNHLQSPHPSQLRCTFICRSSSVHPPGSRPRPPCSLHRGGAPPLPPVLPCVERSIRCMTTRSPPGGRHRSSAFAHSWKASSRCSAMNRSIGVSLSPCRVGPMLGPAETVCIHRAAFAGGRVGLCMRPLKTGILLNTIRERNASGDLQLSGW